LGVAVPGIDHLLGELALAVVVDDRDRGHCLLRFAMPAVFDEAAPDQVADGLTAVHVPAASEESVELGKELALEGDADAFGGGWHGESALGITTEATRNTSGKSGSRGAHRWHRRRPCLERVVPRIAVSARSAGPDRAHDEPSQG
jgi:hypothetical protein